MKTVLTLFLSLLSLISMGSNTTFEKLAEVNKCWREQPDIVAGNLSSPQINSDRSWIRQHLLLVEQILRNRSTANLTAQQAANRTLSLNHLNEYWKAGNFPINEDYAYRTPIFIDKHDNFCAVGYLVKASGHEAVSRMISSRTNLAYVKEMNYPELNKWASDNGFTIDELAWIQPGYPPAQTSEPLGKGVDGEVIDLFADNNTLYVAGKFTKVDSTITANNIAYVTEAGGVYTWHNMGTGVNGQVNAVVKFDNKIFVAGSFSQAGSTAATNVAYWDGSSWHSAGCTYGVINDLIVFNNELYAAGDFDICAALSDVNFAKWDGTYWQQMPELYGHVNTMHVMDTSIILGGAFTWHNNALNVIKWSPNGSFKPFTNSIVQEVKDFEVFHDTVYAVCKKTSSTDSLNLFMKLNNGSWSAQTPALFNSFYPNDGAVSLNTLCVDNNKLMLGGDFRYLPIVGTYALNCLDVTPNNTTIGNWFLVDSAVNKMVIFKGSLIAGGKFKQDASWGPSHVKLNGIARRISEPTAVPGVPAANTFTLYPNPVKNATAITLKNNFEAKYFTIRDLSAKVLAHGELAVQATQQIKVPELAAGIYLIELLNEKGAKVVKKFVIE